MVLDILYLVLVTAVVFVLSLGIVIWWKMPRGWMKYIIAALAGVFAILSAFSVFVILKTGATLAITQPSDPIAESIRELNWGSIAFAVPEEMQYRKVHDVFLKISPSLSAEQLESALRRKLNSAEVRVVKEANVRLSGRMQARLTGAGFDVIQISPTIQVVAPDAATTWQWQVKPLETGELYLYLSLDARIEVEGADTPYVVRTYDRKVRVNITAREWATHFVKANWQWLWAVFIGPLLLAIWHWARRRRKTAKTNQGQ